MPNSGLFDILCNGSGGRLAFGSVILVYIVVYNEVCGPAVVFATLLATIYGLIAATCKSHLRSLQMPYIRASNKFDYTCLFLATWMDALAVLAACGALARTLSVCLDAMTGGLARIFILGRNSPANEPWPDVLGVAVVFLVTGMFMLGLEHTKAFSFIMSLSMLGLSAVLSAVGWWTGDTMEWQHIVFLPNGVSSFLTAAALLTYCYPSDFPMQRIGLQRFIGLTLTLVAFLSLILAASCLSTIIHYNTSHDYFAVPIFNILEEKGFQKLTPFAACLLMLTCSGAFLELFPELYGIITRFATSEWKVLSKQISYESSESGNPVLAVFIGGSLCAMLAFACPMQHLSYILAASHLSAGCFRAFYLLYTPFRPKYIQQSSSDSSLSYSRLSTAPMVKSASSTSRKRSLWNINLPMQTTVKKPKTKTKNKHEVEKEWLLLGEPSSPCPQREQRDIESTVLSDGDAPPSDFEYPEKLENSDSDTSTDIDAIVDEYRQKIKVTTAGPMERTVRVPTVSSWRVTMFAILVLGLGIALTVAGLTMHWPPATITGGIGIFIIGTLMSFIPKYTGSVVSVSPLLCCFSLATGVILFAACAVYSWAAIIFWLIAGLLLLFRCDNWFCSCFNQTTTINEPLIPSVSAKTTTIRMPRPPKGIVTIPTRITGTNR